MFMFSVLLASAAVIYTGSSVRVFLGTTEGNLLARMFILLIVFVFIISPDVTAKFQGLPTDRFIPFRDLSIVGQRGRFSSTELRPFWTVANFFIIH